ncbi:MAG: response regulator transcription factor [Pelobacteraceae bacterium]
MSVKIVIADDHDVVRQGLKMIIFESLSDMVIVGEASNGREALAQAEALRPDVIIMDIGMPELNGIEATRMICECVPSIKTVMLSMHHTNEHVFRAMQAGARAYILKESAGSCIVNAIRAVMKGHQYFGVGVEDPSKTCSFDHRSSLKSPVDSLSQREREVIQFVVEGKSSAVIAEILLLSPKSVETYRSRLMLKLRVNNIPSLVKFALLHGITSTE